MSTAHEVIIAKHCGMNCLGISLVTNAAVFSEEPESNVSHEEVLVVGKKRAPDVENLVSCIVKKLNEYWIAVLNCTNIFNIKENNMS